MLIRSRQFRRHVVILLSLWVAALIAVLSIDRPLALWVHSVGIDQWLILRNVTEGLPKLVTVLAIGALLFRYWKVAENGKLRGLSSGILCSVYFYLMLKLTMQVKTYLKIFFGRYWTKTWIADNLSLIHDGVFGFNWWHGVGNEGCFPSGHSTYMAFCCIWLCYAQPRLKSIWLILLALMPINLIILDYHFLGDCLAGLSLGYCLALISIWLLHRMIMQYNKKSNN